jgi:hypothetical protein
VSTPSRRVHIHGDLNVREEADFDLIARRLAFALDRR